MLSRLAQGQTIPLTHMLRYAKAPLGAFEQEMLRQGFVCYQNRRSIGGWTCLFAYQPTPYWTAPEQALALLQLDHSSRYTVLTYQLRSHREYRRLYRSIRQQGYQLQTAQGGRGIYRQGQSIITCQLTDPYNALSGNYSGHTFTFVRPR